MHVHRGALWLIFLFRGVRKFATHLFTALAIYMRICTYRGRQNDLENIWPGSMTGFDIERSSFLSPIDALFVVLCNGTNFKSVK